MRGVGGHSYLELSMRGPGRWEKLTLTATAHVHK